eukprot:SAG31_NODE_310_length_17887_cov_4.623060_3_plen_195_part_00
MEMQDSQLDAEFRAMLREIGKDGDPGMLALGPKQKRQLLESHHERQQSLGTVDLYEVMSEDGDLDIVLLSTRLKTCGMAWMEAFIHPASSDTISLKGLLDLHMSWTLQQKFESADTFVQVSHCIQAVRANHPSWALWLRLTRSVWLCLIVHAVHARAARQSEGLRGDDGNANGDAMPGFVPRASSTFGPKVSAA